MKWPLFRIWLDLPRKRQLVFNRGMGNLERLEQLLRHLWRWNYSKNQKMCPKATTILWIRRHSRHSFKTLFSTFCLFELSISKLRENRRNFIEIFVIIFFENFKESIFFKTVIAAEKFKFLPVADSACDPMGLEENKLETISCNSSQCPYLSPWTDFSSCTTSCGESYKHRNRTCFGMVDLQSSCNESLFELVSCNLPNCTTPAQPTGMYRRLYSFLLLSEIKFA